VGLRFVFKNARHRSREYAGWALARLLGHRHYASHLARDEISSILICRINGRIGNTLFLTPLIRYLHELLPHATIDLALAYPQAQELLQGLPGTRQIIVLPHRRPQAVGRYLAALRRLRAQRYDLAIDPTEFSTSSRLMLSLTRSRYRLGFAGRGQWAPLTHAVALPRQALHQAVRPLCLPQQIFGIATPPHEVRLWLPLSAEELAAGRQLVQGALGPAYRDGLQRVFGFFAHAANLKRLDRAWWLAFWEAFLRLEPLAVPLEFLPAPAQARINEGFPATHVPSTRALTAAIAATRLFISTDTGPMHLASSTAVPTVGLFLASDPKLYGPLKPDDLAIRVDGSTPQEIARRCQVLWQAALPGSLAAAREQPRG
jgi:ADP-heptose:LPS heptosyltransferase